MRGCMPDGQLTPSFLPTSGLVSELCQVLEWSAALLSQAGCQLLFPLVQHHEGCPACAQAALDVFSKEPPPPDNPLIGRPDVVCTPHLGASTTEAQEGVALEIAEAVVSALKVHLLPQSNPHHP